MDNIQGLAESKGRNKSSPYKCLTTLAAFLSILEFLEVWGCGWTLLTLLSPDDLNPSLWNGTTVAQQFHDIPLREQYVICVVAYLAFFLLFVITSFLLLWGNWYNKITPFLMYQATVVLSVLLSIIITIYFVANDHERAFLFITNPEDGRSIPYLLLLLYFSRYFAVGWILKAAFISCSSQRRNRIEEDKDIQGEVDKAFKNVFDSVHDKNTARGRHYEEDRPPSVPEYVQKIPRIRLSHAGGYINKGFEYDGRAPAESRYADHTRHSEDDYMERYGMRDLQDYAAVDLRPKHRRSRSEDLYGQHLNGTTYQDNSGRLPADPPIELGDLSPSDVRKSRPLSGYSFREGFGYGPGPRGYDVPSPHSEPKSSVGHGEHQGLRREESLVRRLSARYEDNAGLRSGPAPTGGVPAIGPASIRRVPARTIPNYY
ncbi:uncharacterized protein LOC135395072 [Ornithodoros turicata]